MTEEDFERWIDAAYFYMLSDYVVAVTLAETNIAQDISDKWISSGVELKMSEELDGFVRAAAPELPRGIRVNIVSPGWVRESIENMDVEVRTNLGLSNVTGTPAHIVAQAYVQAIEGTMQGQMIRP